jgi:hypothetical protein
MRLHQRVGRLNRIGQTEKVKVMMFQNPDTVESRIWLLLNEKLERIRCSLNAVTEDPEDLHQLILGVTQPGMLDQIFSEAESIPKKRLVEWFNQQTGQLGVEEGDVPGDGVQEVGGAEHGGGVEGTKDGHVSGGCGGGRGARSRGNRGRSRWRRRRCR